MTDLFDKLHALRRDGIKPFGPEVDEAALLVARQLRDGLMEKFKIDLSDVQWTRAVALMQVRLAAVIRHAAFDRPKFPPNKPWRCPL